VDAYFSDTSRPTGLISDALKRYIIGADEIKSAIAGGLGLLPVRASMLSQAVRLGVLVGEGGGQLPEGIGLGEQTLGLLF